MFTLFCSIAVACGFDWTFGFLWLQGETGLEWMQDLEGGNVNNVNNITATLTDAAAAAGVESS